MGTLSVPATYVNNQLIDADHMNTYVRGNLSILDGIIGDRIRSAWMPVTSWRPPATSSMGALEALTNGIIVRSCATGVSSYANIGVQLPPEATGSIALEFVWFTSSTAAGDVRLGTVIDRIETGGTISADALTIVKVQASAGALLTRNTSLTSTGTPTGYTSSSFLLMKMLRDGSHATDTYGGTVYVAGAMLYYEWSAS